ncbi:glycosyltransferase family 4 protein [Pedobacter fastidiosus]|uniref:Glycosyltransferase family 4 protein n=1 Tax=Pedobacter fastidiosus TaxID=2765361 RepID=A0ABR7KVM2_9SPHI|nr:glycosyltransferase family 4 protein [Pedobacter fastidiosus]MBC6112158.1 glycosyltransferase family 4 protein [Pedobacter fastidiosus]
MRIAITADPFIPVPPLNYGGIERIIHFLVEGLVQNGHEVILVAHKDSKCDSELLAYSSDRNGLMAQFKNAQTISKLKKWNPDVIHSFSRLAYLLPFLQSNIPKIMSYQREPTLSQIKKAVYLSKGNSLSFTGCSNYISDQIIPYATTQTIYNGIDLSLYKFEKEISDDAPLIFLGRIESIKGTHEAIKAAQVTNRKLIIAGNIAPQHRNYFDKQIKPHISNQIEYVGEVNDVQKNKLLGSCAALLMPIGWNEPFGIVMAEALACGTPVIGYPRGAVSEVIKHGKNGFLSTSFTDLCIAIGKIKEISRGEVRATAEKNFSSKKIVDDYIAYYLHCLSNNKATK